MKDTKHIRRDFHSVPWVGLWGAGGAQGTKKKIFKHGHVVYQINGDDQQNRMQEKFSSKGQTGDLGVRSKVKYHLISVTMSILKIFTPNLCVFSQMKDIKHIRRDFYSVAWVMPQGWDFEALGVPRGSNNCFFKHGHVAYKIDSDDEQNKMQVTFSS